MELTVLQPADLHFDHGLQPDGWGDIQPALQFYTSSSFCFPLKVMIGDTIVGVGTSILHDDVAWLGHIIVHKDFRRRGIGLFITQSLVEKLSATACKTIYLLATDMGAPVYEKAGFETETEYLFFKDVEFKHPIADQHVKKYHADYKEQVAEMDLLTSGENRFFHLETYLDEAFVYIDEKTVRGFYLPAFGDGLIIANDPEAGLALLQLRMETNNKIVFPKNNAVAAGFLYQNGSKEVSVGKRMRLGEKRSVRFQDIYSRIGGNLG